MKDPQANKVYVAEERLLVPRPDFRTVAQAERWANQIVASRWFEKNWPHMKHRVVQFDRRMNKTCCTAWPVYNRIALAPFGKRKLVVCHELAHLCNVESEAYQQSLKYAFNRGHSSGLASHGPKFCEIYLQIVEKALSEKMAMQLKLAFVICGVQFGEPYTKERRLKFINKLRESREAA